MDVTVMSGVTDRNTVQVVIRDNLSICVYVCFFLFYNSICSGILHSDNESSQIKVFI